MTSFWLNISPFSDFSIRTSNREETTSMRTPTTDSIGTLVVTRMTIVTKTILRTGLRLATIRKVVEVPISLGLPIARPELVKILAKKLSRITSLKLLDKSRRQVEVA